MSLTVAEADQLVELMNKVELPAPLPIFLAWCKVFGTTPAEVVLLRDGQAGPEIFFLYRKDDFFQGWHIPGCVHLPTESFAVTIKRVIDDEIKMTTTEPEFFGWFERLAGNAYGQSPRGHELSLVFTTKLTGQAKESETAKFFPLDLVPADLITNQNQIIKKIQEKYGQN